MLIRTSTCIESSSMKQNFYDCLSEIARGHNWVGSAMLLAYECFSQLPVSLQSDPHIADMANMNTDNFEYMIIRCCLSSFHVQMCAPAIRIFSRESIKIGQKRGGAVSALTFFMKGFVQALQFSLYSSLFNYNTQIWKKCFQFHTWESDWITIYARVNYNLLGNNCYLFKASYAESERVAPIDTKFGCHVRMPKSDACNEWRDFMLPLGRLRIHFSFPNIL